MVGRDNLANWLCKGPAHVIKALSKPPCQAVTSALSSLACRKPAMEVSVAFDFFLSHEANFSRGTD